MESKEAIKCFVIIYIKSNFLGRRAGDPVCIRRAWQGGGDKHRKKQEGGTCRPEIPL